MQHACVAREQAAVLKRTSQSPPMGRDDAEGDGRIGMLPDADPGSNLPLASRQGGLFEDAANNGPNARTDPSKNQSAEPR